MTPSRPVRFLLFLLLLVSLVGSGATVAFGSHYDESQYRPLGKSDTRVDTYGASTADARAPGASDVSYWTESILHSIPEDESVYMKRSVTYRPMASNCGAGDIDVLGVDRDNTYEGERRVDEDVTDSIKAFEEDEDAHDRYERKYGADGNLTTTDSTQVERFVVEWYDRNDFGTPVQLFHEDRFVSAQRECFENPDQVGWYRTASIVTVELENGTTFQPEEPTFSHWFYVCACEDREAAVETLGPPPSEATDGTPTPTANAASDADAGGRATLTAADQSTGSESDDSTAPTPTPAVDSAGTPSTGAVESEPTATSPGSWERAVVRTPTAAAGSGFGTFVALVAILTFLVLTSMRRPS